MDIRFRLIHPFSRDFTLPHFFGFLSMPICCLTSPRFWKDIRQPNMFLRLTLRTHQITRPILTPVGKSSSIYAYPVRGFFNSASFQKKAKKGAKIVEEEPVYQDALERIDIDAAKQRLQGVIDRFAKYANDAKLGKSNPKVFDNLTVHTDHGEMPYTSVAQTSIKGRNFIITVYDPVNVKHIINSVLGSDLNLNPIADPSNKLTLKVPLPPVTTESKKESVKELKGTYEKLRNGSGTGKNGSLLSIRTEIRHKLTKNKKLDNAETEVWNDFEKIHKTYSAKLADLMKTAETAILK